MGKFSRNKGNRVEYQIRDKFRKVGFCVDRIPASGASQGFKGDLRIKHDNKEIIVEVKARKDEFKRLYEVLEEFAGLTLHIHEVDVVISYDPITCVTKTGTMAWLTNRANLASILRKCYVYRANSDILVVKNDRKPPIYMYWRSEPESVIGNV